ncbi:hypothetical protein Mapa_013882 [Marchantia paleacea]|nr:hypothetical protein Mapa_013882 [Marchantia paleacea]
MSCMAWSTMSSCPGLQRENSMKLRHNSFATTCFFPAYIRLTGPQFPSYRMSGF